MKPSAKQLLLSIQHSPEGLTLAKLLALHPELARRTVQRWLSESIIQKKIVGVGAGRARRYAAATPSSVLPWLRQQWITATYFCCLRTSRISRSSTTFSGGAAAGAPTMGV